MNKSTRYTGSGITILPLLFLMGGCNEEAPKEPAVPEHISRLENLSVYAPYAQPVDTVELIKEAVFESNEEVFIKGYIGEVAVDEQNRVFIEAGNMNERVIYVFQPDGSYLSTIGRQGRGPGEFLSISSMAIQDSQLFVFDPVQQKILVFSISDFSLVREELIKRDEVRKTDTDTLAHMSRGSELLTAEGGSLFIRLSNLALTREEDISKILYYRLSKDGRMLPVRILELERFRFFFPENERRHRPVPLPFGRSSLVAVSEDGPIYTAWTEDFLIKVHDKNGNYQRAIYYPYQKSTLNASDLQIGEARNRAIRENKDQVPDTWPALHAMEVDDQNRLWVFSITDSDTTYQGWVLNQEGKLSARFSFPGKRSERSVMAPSFLAIIKNGHLYTRERDIRARIDRIVKYKIVMKQR